MLVTFKVSSTLSGITADHMSSERIFAPPSLTPADLDVIREVRGFSDRLSDVLRVPKRWTGSLRRTAQARALQGSNTIEGYTVTTMDAAAAVDSEEPLTADQETWAEIVGYRRMMTYILGMAPDPHFQIDSQTLRSLHFMLLEHDMKKAPGRFRTGAIWISSSKGGIVYEGPDPERVPALIDQLILSLRSDGNDDTMVDAAMAHLNLVMIHPFSDGNGRMSRALQTLVLAHDNVVEPTFSSIEEWLGANTEAYYQVLAATGRGAWNPQNDTSNWVRFCIRAHHMQAQTVQRRFREAEELWFRLDKIIGARALPDRVLDALFDAALGAKVTRGTYIKRTAVEERQASRDLIRLSDAGLLNPHGSGRGRYYLPGEKLDEVRAQIRADRTPLTDPYPNLMKEIRASLP